MANEEKILEMLGTINDRLGRLETTQDKMQKDLDTVKAAQTQMQATQTQMQEDLDGVKKGLDDVKTTQAQMQEDITRINVTLEVKIAKEIQFLADGHVGINEKLQKLDEIEKKLEDVSIRADSAHAAAVVNEYEITQLKRAR